MSSEQTDTGYTGRFPNPESTFQAREKVWLMACVGEPDAKDRRMRVHRFLEEAIELGQACGCTADEVSQLSEYVFAGPVGEIKQEIGGTMNTLAALATAHEIDLMEAANGELVRCWQKLDKIRAKHNAKPKIGPLPEAKDVQP